MKKKFLVVYLVIFLLSGFFFIINVPAFDIGFIVVITLIALFNAAVTGSIINILIYLFSRRMKSLKRILQYWC